MRRVVTTLALTTLSAMLLGAPALAGGGGGGPCRGYSEGDEVAMLDLCFDGAGHVVEAGTTLTVVNQGEMPHDFTAVDGSFGTGTLAAGESAELTIDEPGQFPVYCTLHASDDGWGMSGLLVVTDGAASGSPAAEATSGAVAAPVDGEAAATDADAWGWWLLVVVALVVAAGLARRALTRRGPSDTDDTAAERSFG